MDISAQIATKPTPGKFYSIVYGDTLFGITSWAYGVSPGPERLDYARLINRAKYNDRFRGQPTNFFPEGLITFNPRFDRDPNAQANATGAAPSGHGFATIWLPLFTGDEPNSKISDDHFIVAVADDDAEEEEEEYHDVEPYYDTGIPEDSTDWFSYKVTDGDSLHSIADSLDVTWEFLAELNWNTAEPERVTWHLQNHFRCALPVTEAWQFSDQDVPGLILLPRQDSHRIAYRRKRLFVSRHATIS